MKHLGDITKIDGRKVPIVNVLVGGSPCQDLSLAGQRKGIRHSDLDDSETTRSGLFMEQVRIAKEMREESERQLRTDGRTDEYIRLHTMPRYFVWENVVGALSSSSGADFHAVLEETIKIIDKDADVPGLAKGQKWQTSGCIVGDGWSLAWRVHDAQYHGVPQRRRRICLVADFNGQSAPEIVFELRRETDDPESDKTFGDTRRINGQPKEVLVERKGLQGNPESCEETEQGSATDSIGGIESADSTITFLERAGKTRGNAITMSDIHTTLSMEG